MKGNVLVSAATCLLLCWMLPVFSMKISITIQRPKAKKVQLNMGEKAVDDMYFGCNKTMTKRIKDKYFKEENKGNFANVWKNAETCAKQRLEIKDKGDEALTKDHMQAICAYTSDDDKFYKTFNDEVRVGRDKYSTSFPYHSLHFWLTSAVKILRKNQPHCHISYRGSETEFIGKVNQVMRFGSFTSSSMKTSLEGFGKETCFKITTCSGAMLKKYSEFKHEEEVLIPPYEIFKITEKPKGKKVKGLEDCKVVYVLQSVGILSNLNCKVGYENPVQLGE